MSFAAAVGRIDQILSLQQQVSNPALAGGMPQAAATAAQVGGSSDFASALASAQAAPGASASAAPGATASAALGGAAASAALGGSTASAALGDPTASAALGDPTPSAAAIDPSAQSPLSIDPTALQSPALPASMLGLPAASGAADPRVSQMLAEANSLVGQPYIVGGGHSGWGPQQGYDCSGFVSTVLHAGGYLSSPVDTTALPSQPGMEPGPGQYVTVYDRALPGQSGHVIIDIAGQFYESGGMHGAWGGGGGVERIATPSAAYLQTFPTILHPAGL
ncbi:MAG: hypothetical protein ACRDMX_08015 [Solirubrobacteraceae bacterium]